MKRTKRKTVGGRLAAQYIITVLLFSAVFIFTIPFLKLIFDTVVGNVGRYMQLSNSYISCLYALNEHYVFVVIAFFMVIMIINFIFFIRAARLPDRVYSAFSGIVNDDYTVPSLPREIKARHRKTADEIKSALKYRDYLAKESEQRKNDLVVYLAHDLKTPLTSIIGYLTLLEEAPELPAEYRAKYMGITLEKAYRLEQLINEFFDITRFNLQNITLENNHIDLGLMLSQIADEFYPVLSEKHLLCRVDAADGLNIIGDADKLSRVFDNLMRNAVNYSYPDTEISISAGIHNGRAVVVFRNKGDKISSQKINMIFEKFFRADDSRTSKTGGAGLGLAIAKQIVELHGGEISAKSNDEFTAFTVALPLQS